MKNIATLFLCLICSITFTQEDALLQDMIIEKGIVGIAAGYAVDGEVAWINSAGFQNRKEKIPFNDSTLNRTASIAKSMTAIGIMQLVEANKLSLDATIGDCLRGLPEDKKAITITQLLLHTSGILGYKSSKETENTTEYANMHDAMQVFINRELKFESGTAFYYSTYGYVVLGAIIEEVTGMSFEAYMQEHIWTPSGMQDTGVEHEGAVYANKSELYHKKKKKAKEGHYNNLSNRTPGGGFYSTIGDLLKFGNAVIDNKLISQESLDLMLALPAVKKEGNQYAYGWFLYGPAPNEKGVFGHSGEQTGTATQLLINPSKKRVVVVMANTSGTWGDVIGLSAGLMNWIGDSAE